MMTTRCRYTVLFSLALFLAAAPSPMTASDPLEAVRARFAPDRRLAVFDVTHKIEGSAIVVSGEVESDAARRAALDAIAAAGAHRIVDHIKVLPDEALGTLTDAIVRVSVANVRSKPAHSAEMVTQTLLGWPVRVLKEQSGWFLVHTEPDGYLGWIEALQLSRMTRADRERWQSSERLLVTTPYAVIRDAPGPSGAPLADVVSGDLVRSIDMTAGWAKVVLPDDRSGYVPGEAVQNYSAWKAATRATAVGIERTANLFTGVPYLWGGTSSKGFDCSGFTKIVFRMNGIELPRDTDQQATMGQAVPLDAALSGLEAGDLLFFGTAATADRPERISHVAIHLGRLEFIHASGLVRRNSLDPSSPIFSASLRSRLLRARRVLQSTRITS